MDLGVWAAFVLASALVVAAPGPSVVLVSALAARHGGRAAAPLVLGVMCGDIAALLISFAGLGALLSASAELFAAVKWAAAAYLVWLGVRQWRAPVCAAPMQSRRAPLFRKAFLTTAANPKTLVFFTAFIPQFISDGAPFAPQFAVLAASFMAVAAVNISVYAVFAVKIGGALKENAGRKLNRISGGALIGAGIWTANRAAE